jgi:hypothetical protein
MNNIDNFGEKLVKSIKADSNALKNEIISLNKELEKLDKKKRDLEAIGNTTGKVYQNIASGVRITKTSLEEAEKQLDANTKALKLNNGSIQQNKAFLESLTVQYDRISKAKGNASNEAQKLDGFIGNLNSTIESQSENLKKNREQFDFHKGSVDALKGSFNEIKDKAKEFNKETGKAGPDLASSLESVTTGFNAMEDGLSVVKTGFQGVGGAIKATGFGLLVLALESVTEWLTKSTTGQKYLSGGLTAIAKVVEIVKKAFQDLGGKIFNAIIHPVDTIKSVWKDVVTTLSNQFKPFSTMLEGIFSGNFGKVKEGYAQLKSNASAIAKSVVSTYQNAKDGLISFVGEIKDAYDEGFNKKPNVPKPTTKHHREVIKEIVDLTKQAEEDRLASIARMAKMTLQGYAKEIADANEHFKELKSKYNKFLDDYSKMDAKGKAAHKKEYAAVNAAIEQQEIEHQATLNAITKKFQDEDVKKLDGYHKELNKIGKNARQLAIQQVNEDYANQAKELETLEKTNRQIATDIEGEILTLNIQKLATTGKTQLEAIDKQVAELEKKRAEAQSIADDAKQILAETGEKHNKDLKNTNKDFDQQDETKAEGKVQGEVSEARESGHESAAIKKELELLNMQHDFKIQHETHTQDELLKINSDYAKKKADLENKLVASKIHAGDKYIDAVLKNTKKDSAIYKAAFLAKKATAIADVIMSTKTAIIESFKGYAGMPFIGQALAIAQGAFIATQGAMSIADIAKQKPGFARGGQYTSDGRGALLPGYSRTDNTNAYLRSGEAVVVSEAMRNPWARNLVSAINVAHGGRDFSIPNPGRGYAIGGIFTDGGNANRYYSQPVNDQKDMANTLAYQMLNNFPPIYVDVKDVNNQQNILAQTVDRVNL